MRKKRQSTKQAQLVRFLLLILSGLLLLAGRCMLPHPILV
ncbi:hypothetical protein EI42_04411 [Thermosporothrix hazakensis]|uniref:Uncharacterized protein n=1 Tax=Thermosporothrix hazakensis TaxID=644383 RepID=A0A326U261_THEHA|nr:hypothetical protein EI42_04411 [Thermosporothrix hazakensis]